MKLKPFNPKARCPKCGHDVVEIKYHKKGSYGFEIYQEHFHRTCLRCSYSWPERCLTKKELATLPIEISPEPTLHFNPDSKPTIDETELWQGIKNEPN